MLLRNLSSFPCKSLFKFTLGFGFLSLVFFCNSQSIRHKYEEITMGLLKKPANLSTTPPKTTKRVEPQQSSASNDIDSKFPPITGIPGYDFMSNTDLSYQNNHYLPAYNFHYCKIDKNSGTAMQAVMCYLYDPQLYRKLFTSGHWPPGLYGAAAGICGWLTTNGELRKQTEEAVKKGDFFARPDLTHFAVIRHPISRFISAWSDVCYRREAFPICYKCKQDLECFITKHHEYIMKKANKKENEIVKWRDDWHFFPQAWFCDFENQLQKYKLLQYDTDGTFVKELSDLLSAQGVPLAQVTTINSTLTQKSTTHKNSLTKSQNLYERIYNDEKLLRILYNTFYIDFKLFNFDLKY